MSLITSGIKDKSGPDGDVFPYPNDEPAGAGVPLDQGGRLMGIC